MNSGAAQQIISLMPRHRIYVEAFLGAGEILARKRPAELSVAADLNPAVIARHQLAPLPAVDYEVASPFDVIARYADRPDALIYVDPPHRRGALSLKPGQFELYASFEHEQLLDLVTSPSVTAAVIISGHRCELYDRVLASWHRHDYAAGGRDGRRLEPVWCNFEPGVSFHDTRYLGANFKQREHLKLKRRNWTKKFAAMNAGERAIVLEVIEDVLAAAPPASRPARAIAPAGIDVEDLRGRGEDVVAGEHVVARKNLGGA